jgi:stage IV sporulation protein A
VKITLKGKSTANVRLIDCVGFMVEGAIGDKENDKPRLVKTPWSNDLIPFEKASEIGTQKVIAKHSTIAVMVTTDGSVSSIPRENYVVAEEKTVAELVKANKPFIIVINSVNPNSESCEIIKREIEGKYGVGAICLNLQTATADDLTAVIEKVLLEFPMRSFDVVLPKWMQVLPPESKVITGIINAVNEVSPLIEKMKHGSILQDAVSSVEGVKQVKKSVALLGEGKTVYEVEPDKNLFYSFLSELAGDEIDGEYKLMSFIKELSVAKQNYNKLKNALLEVNDNGYGIVVPSENEMILQDPEVVRYGSRYGVKLKAGSNCMHLIKINLDAEVTPVYGTKQQCTDYADFIKNQYAVEPEKVWNSSVFGKPLSSIIASELQNKVASMKEETKAKMKKTVTKIINEKKATVFCILI